jgi:excisionase family DNA binding protein
VSETYLTLSEARAMLNVSRATLWRWEMEHGLKVVRVGNVARIRESDLQAFLKRHESGGHGADPSDSGRAVS